MLRFADLHIIAMRAQMRPNQFAGCSKRTTRSVLATRAGITDAIESRP